MTPGDIFDALDVGLDIVGLAVARLPGDAAELADQILDAISDALPEIETLATTPGWDAGDVAAVRNILIRALSENPRLPTADVLSHADSFARIISRAVSAGLKQDAPVVRGRGRRRRRVLADVHVEGGKARGDAVAAGLLPLRSAQFGDGAVEGQPWGGKGPR